MMELWEEQDDVIGPLDSFWGHLGKGAIVETEDGERWTTVYGGLGGYGVIAGEHPDMRERENHELPNPTHWLREPHRGADGPCLGLYVRLIEDGTHERNPDRVSHD